MNPDAFKCPACNEEWAHHKGIALTCEQNAKLRAENAVLRERVAYYRALCPPLDETVKMDIEPADCSAKY